MANVLNKTQFVILTNSMKMCPYEKYLERLDEVLIFKQRDQILKDISYKLSHNIGPSISQLFGNFKNDTNEVKTVVAVLWSTFGKTGRLFIPISGHTGLLKSSFCKYKRTHFFPTEMA